MDTLHVSKILNSKTITYRELVKKLEKEVNRDTRFIDLSDIIFVSPSSAHELIEFIMKHNLKVSKADKDLLEQFRNEAELRDIKIDQSLLMC